MLGAVERVDAGIALMVEAAGGWTAFLDRYAVAIVADHSQSAVHEVADLSADTDLRLFRSSRRDDPDECDLALTASNRVAMAYLMPGAGLTGSEAAHRLARHPAVDVTMWREGDWRAVRREGGELRFRRGGDHQDERGGRWSVAGDRDLLDPAGYPNALERIDGSLGSGAPATSWCRRVWGGSSPTPAATTTPAAAATGRCGPRTRSSRWSPRASGMIRGSPPWPRSPT